jgi:hypothetical protein
VSILAIWLVLRLGAPCRCPSRNDRTPPPTPHPQLSCFPKNRAEKTCCCLSDDRLRPTGFALNSQLIHSRWKNVLCIFCEKTPPRKLTNSFPVCAEFARFEVFLSNERTFWRLPRGVNLMYSHFSGPEKGCTKHFFIRSESVALNSLAGSQKTLDPNLWCNKWGGIGGWVGGRKASIFAVTDWFWTILEQRKKTVLKSQYFATRILRDAVTFWTGSWHFHKRMSNQAAHANSPVCKHYSTAAQQWGNLWGSFHAWITEYRSSVWCFCMRRVLVVKLN